MCVCVCVFVCVGGEKRGDMSLVDVMPTHVFYELILLQVVKFEFRLVCNLRPVKTEECSVFDEMTFNVCDNFCGLI